MNLCKTLYVQHCRRGILNRYASSSADVVKDFKSRSPTSRVMAIARERKIPVEKFSLSRGLALNRFEKVRFLICFFQVRFTPFLKAKKPFCSLLCFENFRFCSEFNGCVRGW